MKSASAVCSLLLLSGSDAFAPSGRSALAPGIVSRSSGFPTHAKELRPTVGLSVASVDDDKLDAKSVETLESASGTELSTGLDASTLQMQVPQEDEWENQAQLVELAFLFVWLGSLSGFIFANNWIGPWPAMMTTVPERIYFVCHMLGGMLFGGGVIMTTGLEWLVVKNKNGVVLQFYFDKIPLLDSALVLPGLTIGMISGTGLCITRYGSLGTAPAHIPAVFYCLTAFAAWWAATDLATQAKALRAVDEWVAQDCPDEVPKIVEDRFISNIVSCGFVVLLYAVMVLKPGTLPQYTPHLPAQLAQLFQ